MWNEAQTSITKRNPQAKIAHLEACLLPESQYKKSAGFEEVLLENDPSAGLSLDQISCETVFLGRAFSAPLMIAPMTGGTQFGAMLNERWARACEWFRLPMGVGSQRLALEDKHFGIYYDLRKYAPTAFLFGNLGAGQLCTTMGPKDVCRAIDMIRADAFFIHVNAIQEACQKGDVHWVGLLKKLEELEKVLRPLSIPLFVREVGFGFSKRAVRRLLETGISGIDCAGAGGTSWARVEGICCENDTQKAIAETFGEWGIPTVQSIINVRQISGDIPLIATGGIRSGLDVAKAIYLGADMAALAQPFLVQALKGEEQLFRFIERIIQELRIAMFGTGSLNLKQLRPEDEEITHLSSKSE